MTIADEIDFGTPASRTTEQVAVTIDGRTVTVPAGTYTLTIRCSDQGTPTPRSTDATLVITIDDVVDVIEEEADEDLKALGGVTSDAYVNMGVAAANNIIDVLQKTPAGQTKTA